MNRVTAAVLGTFVVILVGSGIFAYFLRDQPGSATSTSTAAAAPTPVDHRDIPLFGQLFGPDATGLSPATFQSWEASGLFD